MPRSRAALRPAARERAALADLLERSGPDAPTLCEGWATRDLAAHLVLRESRPDAAAGFTLASLPLLRRRTERAMRSAVRRPFDDLVRALRTGPPRLGPFSLPGADGLLHTAEMFVHHEDVRRAVEGWEPRRLYDEHEAALWGAAQATARHVLGRCPVGVVLVVPGGRRSKVHRGVPAVALTGPASELVLHLMGRRDQALVEVGGPAEAVEAYRTWLG